MGGAVVCFVVGPSHIPRGGGEVVSSMGAKRWLALAISCSVAVALLAVAAWMLLDRGNSHPADSAVQIIPPTEITANAGPQTHDPSASTAPPEQVSLPQEIAVYITGAVVNPGVYTATTEQRLDTVLALAGGPTDDADLSRINLAAYVTDASHYKIPSVNDSNPGGDQSAGSGTAASQGGSVANSCLAPVDINTATAECLETLPGIGSVRAEAIVAHREQTGPFATKQDITAVSGIGDGIYRRISEMITVTPAR